MRILSLIGVLAIGASLTLVGCDAVSTTDATASAVAQTGNGAPSGAHYTLNIIGVPKAKTADMDNNNGRRIFVNLEGNTKIMLTESLDGSFAVLDANGTDRDGAAFQLPNPDPDNDGVTVYSVFARPLGTPGGSAKLTTCATYTYIDEETGEEVEEEVCSVDSLEVERTRGKQKFTNVSRQLLYIYVDLDGDGTEERYNLFADELEDYFWSYDNSGLRVLQLRFYEVPTDVEA